jgi:hypothetical protein
MALSIQQRAFKLDQITYLDRKSILLDRVLLNLFELLRFDGRPPLWMRRRKPIEVEALVQQMIETPSRFEGFDQRPDVSRAWLENDLLDLMNRGKPDRERVVGPRPFHLNAYKLANQREVADHGGARQVYALIYHADPDLLTHLNGFFGRGLDRAQDRYDGSTALDLETLAVLGLADQVEVKPATEPVPVPIRPLCLLQGQRLSQDVRALLAYEGIVPRTVLAGYVRTILGVHLALHMTRVIRLLPEWIEQARAGAEPRCCVDGCDREDCAYDTELAVDLTDNPVSGPAVIAQGSAAELLSSVPEYVRAVILVNRLRDFADAQAKTSPIPKWETVHHLLALLRDPPGDLDGFFRARIADATSGAEDEAVHPHLEAIARLGLSPLDQYVELVCLYRLKRERSDVIKLLDSLAQKNRSGGFMRQLASRGAPRWLALDSHLLETLAQIAVVDRSSADGVSTKTILIDEFIEWLRVRYGFVVYAPGYRDVPAEHQGAWRENVIAFRERLHEIGFFTDLSDAYNSQTLRPRYEFANA